MMMGEAWVMGSATTAWACTHLRLLLRVTTQGRQVEASMPAGRQGSDDRAAHPQQQRNWVYVALSAGSGVKV